MADDTYVLARTGPASPSGGAGPFFCVLGRRKICANSIFPSWLLGANIGIVKLGETQHIGIGDRIFAITPTFMRPSDYRALPFGGGYNPPTIPKLAALGQMSRVITIT